MRDERKTELMRHAAEIRRGTLLAVHAAASGHPGGSLSIAEVLSYLYFERMNIDPQSPKMPDRDRLVLSKGHCAPGLYAALSQRGYFPKEELLTFRRADSRLQGHPDMKGTPGVDMTTGSLGLGISAACGMALSAKAFGDPFKVYAIMGDGELDEGQVWEAAMFAAHYELCNLCAWIDLNGLQIDGPTAEVMNSAPVPEKFRSFGWNVVEINAHDFDEIERAYAQFDSELKRPTAIVANSVKGKGVSFMENEAGWHGNAPSDEQLSQALAEIDGFLSELDGKVDVSNG